MTTKKTKPNSKTTPNAKRASKKAAAKVAPKPAKTPARLGTKKHATQIEKVKEFVKNKFRAKPNEEKQQTADDSSTEKQSSLDGVGSKSGSGEALISFFYTNDKFINTFEDTDVITDIQKKYPLFMKEGVDDSQTKKVLSSLVQDKKFIEALLEYYNMSVLDFFKFLFRQEMTVFKGSFLSKMSRLVKDAGFDEHIDRKRGKQKPKPNTK